MRPLSLSFTFELAIDDRKVEVSNYPADAIRLRAIMGGGNKLDEALAGGGMAAYDVLYRFAWQAIRHNEDFAGLEFEEFCDRCTAWAMVGDPPTPTDAGPSNE